ncbi:nucleoid-associated protein [Escherichia coli]|uniref:Nucleoid-associated protein n=1 Tax=Escherichia coli TaxID=562 RepID=A0A376U6R5_ECOLX|nr:nucleoid-associated protein [Escherichia coli]
MLRDSLLEPTETVVEMVAELHRVYSAKNKAYGLFSEESELAQTLRLQRQGEEDFWHLAARQPGACVTN